MSGTTLYTADVIYTPGEIYRDAYFSVEDGYFKDVGSLAQLSVDALKEAQHFKNAMVIPGLVNTHTHSFQSLLKGFCDDEDFFSWRDNALYKYAKTLTPEGIYIGALFAFGEMLLQGITTVCDFFYIHDQGNENDRAIIQAAKDLGIRFTLARTLYDWDGAPQRFQETLDQAGQNTTALINEFKDDPMVSVIPAPHSLHGASTEMIKLGAELAATHDTLFHMHIAEGQYERQMIQEKYGHPPIQFLDSMGVLNDRLVGIHCVWVDDNEIKQMAANGSRLSYNPSSNMFLGDGITPIKEMLEAGVLISLGTDGGCSNNRASIIEEMRMTSLLQKVKHCDSTVTQADDMFKMGTINGGKNLGLPLGEIRPGAPADFVIVDLDDLSMQPRQNAVKNLMYSMTPSAIQAVYIHGQKICQEGQILTVPERDIVSKVQAITVDW